MARLRPQVAKVVGAKFYMQAGQDINIGGRLEQAQYQYTLTDTSSDELNHWAPILLEKLQGLKILTDVASDQQIASPHIVVEVDRDAASRLGVPIANVDAALERRLWPGANRHDLLVQPAGQGHSRSRAEISIRTDRAVQHLRSQPDRGPSPADRAGP